MEPKVPDDIYKTHLENNSETMSKRAGKQTVTELLIGAAP